MRLGTPPRRRDRRSFRRLLAQLVFMGVLATLTAMLVLVLTREDPDSNLVATAAEVTTVVSPSFASTTTTTVPAPWVPSPEDPARILIAGDSDAGAFGPPLVAMLADTAVMDATLDYKVSSGLSRPDFFDWPARFREQLQALDPHVVVVTFGGNDAQDLAIDGRSVPVADPAWTEAYRARVREVLDLLVAGDRHVVWVGIPNASSPSFSARLMVQRDAVVAELEAHPATKRIRYVDAWLRFAGRSGGYADYIVDPYDGVGKRVRADDGFHLNMAGAEILARDIASAVTAALGPVQVP